MLFVQKCQKGICIHVDIVENAKKVLQNGKSRNIIQLSSENVFGNNFGKFSHKHF